MRSFFWAGKKEVNGGQCIVAWETVCRPTCYGGLGVKDLRTQGLALRVRWAWLKRVELDRPWQGLPMCKDAKAEELFQQLCDFHVGKGDRIFFWRDRWLHGRMISEITPSVWEVVATRCKNSRTVEHALVDHSWVLDVPVTLSEDGRAQMVRLWAQLNLVVRNTEEADSFSWFCAGNGKYTAKATYERMCQAFRGTTLCSLSGAPMHR